MEQSSNTKLNQEGLVKHKQKVTIYTGTEYLHKIKKNALYTIIFFSEMTKETHRKTHFTFYTD